MPVWCADQAGPFQPTPQEGQGWQPEGEPACLPHEYIRGGTTKILTLFHPADGEVRLEGAATCTNEVLHGWLKAQLSEVLDGSDGAEASPPPAVPKEKVEESRLNRRAWEEWQDGLRSKPTLPAELPRLRMLLVLDNLTGHKTAAFVRWLLMHGIMPLYTPISGSWLNMAESVQRILKRRALAGQHPSDTGEIVRRFREVTRHWNRKPTPFVWGGKRATRRERQCARRHHLGGSGAQTRRPIRRPTPGSYGHARRK